MTAESPPAAPTEERPPPSKALGRLIGRIRAERGHDGGPPPIGPRGVAELRRLRPDKDAWLALPLLWQLIAEIEDRGVTVRDSDIRPWALLMAGMARMTPHHARPKSPRLGRVLAETGYPEARFLRLLRQEPSDLAFADSWSTATLWLANHAAPIDWHSAWHLLLDHGDEAERTRRRLARDFYAAQPRDDA